MVKIALALRMKDSEFADQSIGPVIARFNERDVNDVCR